MTIQRAIQTHLIITICFKKMSLECEFHVPTKIILTDEIKAANNVFKCVTICLL